MRQRIFQDASVQSQFNWSWWLLNPTELQDSSDYSFDKSTNYADMYDVVIENFKARSMKGELFFNPLYRQVIEDLDIPASIAREGYRKSDLREMTQTGTIPCRPYSPGVPDILPNISAFSSYLAEYQYERDVAVTQAWANIDISEIQALASLGEMPETVRWIKSLIIRAINIFRRYKRKLVKIALRRLTRKQRIDAISDIWLELRYAFRPLCYDMEQATAALQAIVEKGSRQTSRGWNRKLTATNETADVTSSPFHWTVTEAITHSDNYRAGVLYDINSDINGIRSIWGIDKPFEAIWELTPFSFIIDWFLNVGNVISSWSGNAGLSPLGSWVTEEHTISTTVEMHNFSVDADDGTIVSSIVGQTPGVYKSTALYKRRLPSPSRAVLPSVNIRLNVSKIIDLAAIARQIFHSMR